MKTNFKFALAAGLLTLSLGAGLAYAAMSPDDAIKARKACMKAGHGGVMGSAVPMIKGEKPFDAAALKVAFDAEDIACKDYSMLWGADTKAGTAEKTNALPAVWEDPKAFEAAGGVWYAAEQKVRAATDEASFKAAFPALGGSCKGCHEKFRAPTQ